MVLTLLTSIDNRLNVRLFVSTALMTQNDLEMDQINDGESEW